MKFILLSLLIFLTGCSNTVPLQRKFPEIPNVLLEKCPDLQKTKENSNLSDIVKVITTNYSLYHECAAKHDAFVEWYKTQKKIYGENRK
jgi:hypothetical protein